MIVIDYVLLAIVAVSAVISLFRGFVKEAFSLVSWLVAIWAATRFGPEFGELIASGIDSLTLRAWLGRAALLVAVLFAGGLVSWVVSKLLHSTGLSGTDRAVGMVFGLARGIVLAAVFVLLLDFAEFSESSWWTGSKLIPYVSPVAVVVSDLTEDGIEYLDVDVDQEGIIDSASKKAGDMLVP